MKKTIITLILMFSITLCLAWEVEAVSYNYTDTEVYLIGGTYRVMCQGTVEYTTPWQSSNTFQASYQIRNSGGAIVYYNAGCYQHIPEWQTEPINYSESFSEFTITSSGTYYFRGGLIASYATNVISSSARLSINNSSPPGNNQD